MLKAVPKAILEEVSKAKEPMPEKKAEISWRSCPICRQPLSTAFITNFMTNFFNFSLEQLKGGHGTDAPKKILFRCGRGSWAF